MFYWSNHHKLNGIYFCFHGKSEHEIWLVPTDDDAGQMCALLHPLSSLPALAACSVERSLAAAVLTWKHGDSRSSWRRFEERADLCDLFGVLQRPSHTQMRPQFLSVLHLYALGWKWRRLRLSVSSVPDGKLAHYQFLYSTIFSTEGVPELLLSGLATQ